jgi:Mrp family chromosome partitioning ATPase
MGKVFEAMNRAALDRERADTDEDEENIGSAGVGQPGAGRFSFVRYSLGCGHETAQEPPDTRSSNQIVCTATVAPDREVTIDPGRVDPHLVALYSFNRKANEQYNKLALSLISRAAERGFKRILVSSAEEGEGRTTVSLNLACSLARARQRVLVVDCNFSNPGVAQALGVDCETDLVEAFERGQHATAAAIRIRPYGFSIAPIRRPVQNSVELLAAPNFWQLLKGFDQYYDFVLFDSSPLNNGGDSRLLVRYTDTTLLVVEAGRLTSSEMARAVSPFTRDDILGVVINRAAERSSL